MLFTFILITVNSDPDFIRDFLPFSSLWLRMATFSVDAERLDSFAKWFVEGNILGNDLEGVMLFLWLNTWGFRSIWRLYRSSSTESTTDELEEVSMYGESKLEFDKLLTFVIKFAVEYCLFWQTKDSVSFNSDLVELLRELESESLSFLIVPTETLRHLVRAICRGGKILFYFPQINSVQN